MKIRLDFKNKFENLLLEEETMENEILDIQNKLEIVNLTSNKYATDTNSNKVLVDNFFSNNNNGEYTLEVADNEKNQKDINKNTKLQANKAKLFQNIIDQIGYDKKYYNNYYTTEDIIKLVELYSSPEEIKIQISFIDNKIIELGGPMQGWVAKDHQEFLKLKTQFKDKINSLEFLSDLENQLPYITRDELKHHIISYIKFTKFIEVKRHFLERYNKIKEIKDEENKKHILENMEQNNNKQKEMKKDIVKTIEEKKKQVEMWKKG